MDETATFRRRSPRRWPAIALALALIAAALGLTRPWHGGDASPYGTVAQVQPGAGAADLDTGAEVGKLAPNFLLQTLDGRTIRLSELRGRPVFLNFWATWCIFCVAEMPAIQRLADRYGDRLVVVGVNVGQSEAEARAFADQAGIRYPLLLDPHLDVTRAYRVQAMPTSLAVDADGVVRALNYGVLTPPQMEQFVQPLVDAT
jgi:thiol-disulfide isomerase/thioredoxin